MPFHIRPFLTLSLASRLLITLLLMSSVSAYAEWVEIVKTDKFTEYKDPETIRRKGNLVKVWQLRDFNTIQGYAGKSYLSLKMLLENDCTEEQFRILAQFAYSGRMGDGEIVSSVTSPSEWGTNFARLFGSNCVESCLREGVIAQSMNDQHPARDRMSIIFSHSGSNSWTLL